jgi:hypothetical protein
MADEHVWTIEPSSIQQRVQLPRHLLTRVRSGSGTAVAETRAIVGARPREPSDLRLYVLPRGAITSEASIKDDNRLALAHAMNVQSEPADIDEAVGDDDARRRGAYRLSGNALTRCNEQ